MIKKGLIQWREIINNITEQWCTVILEYFPVWAQTSCQGGAEKQHHLQRFRQKSLLKHIRALFDSMNPQQRFQSLLVIFLFVHLFNVSADAGENHLPSADSRGGWDIIQHMCLQIHWTVETSAKWACDYVAEWSVPLESVAYRTVPVEAEGNSQKLQIY